MTEEQPCLHKWSERWGGNSEIKGITWRRQIRAKLPDGEGWFSKGGQLRMWSG